MATDTPKLWRRSVLTAAIETTTGTLATLNAATGVFNAYNVVLDEESDSDDRPGQSALSPLAPVAGAKGGSISFTTDLFGSGSAGTAPSWVTTLLTSCGYTNASGVVTPLTSQAQTLSIGAYRDGILKTLAGCQGTYTMKFVYGKPVKIDWKFMGHWGAFSDVALVAPTYPTILPPAFLGATISLTPSGGSAITTLRISEMELAGNNELYLRPDASDATGFHAGFVTGRAITLKADPEAVSAATENFFSRRDANTSYALSMTVGATSGNQCTIAAPVMYLKPPPKDKQRGNVYALDLEWVCTRSAAAGDDEISYTF